MNIIDQVCTLEQAKRLRELGVKQESLFYWCRIKNPDDNEYEIASTEDFWSLDREWIYHVGHGMYNICESIDEIYSAFTVAELGQLLLEAGFEKVLTFAKSLVLDEIINSAVYPLENETSHRAILLISKLEKGLMKV